MNGRGFGSSGIGGHVPIHAQTPQQPGTATADPYSGFVPAFGVPAQTPQAPQAPQPYAPQHNPYAVAPYAAPAPLVLPRTDTVVDRALAEFPLDSYSVRFCQKLFSIVPFSPTLAPYRTMPEAVMALYPQATPQIAMRALQIASSDRAQSAMQAFTYIDKADATLAAYSGVKSVWGLLKGKGSDALETDPQQAVDAVLKLFGIAYCVHKMFPLPGGVGEQLRAFLSLPSGRAIGVYYGSIELALPFMDNVLAAGGSLLAQLYSMHQASALGRISSFAGADAGYTQQVAYGLVPPVQQVTNGIFPYAKGMASSLASFVPGALNTMDKVAGAAATAADAMPVYRFLGARMIAEASLLMATRGM